MTMKSLMLPFMGFFFGAVSVLKLMDWPGFVDTYTQYDPIAKRSRLYAWTYPLMEVGFSVAYFLEWQLVPVAALTATVMFTDAWGVYGAIRQGSHELRCACLGTVIHEWVEIPLTKFTLFEDLLMGTMAIAVLLL